MDRDASFAEVSRRTVEMLSQTRPWVRLIGVLLWIGVVFLVLGALFMVIAGVAAQGAVIAVGLGLVYGVTAIIYGYFAKLLTAYAACISSLEASETVDDLEAALEVQKNFWRLAGIITVAFLLIYLFIIVFAILGAALMG